MLIDGKTIDKDSSTDAILSEVKKLPSCFPSYNNHNQISEQDNEFIQKNYKLQNTLDNMRACLSICSKYNWNEAAQGLANYIVDQDLQLHPKLTAAALLKQYSKDNKTTQNRETNVANNFILAAAQTKFGQHQKAAETYKKIYNLLQGQIDEKAHYVGQREVGIIDQGKMGTDNLQQCVAVVVHDPKTKKTALAHVDAWTDLSSLSNIISNDFKNNTNLNVYLIGANSNLTADLVAVSKSNTEKILKELNTHDKINIKQQTVLNPNYPPAFVFDTENATITNAVPTLKFAEPGRKYRVLIGMDHALYKAFDLSNGHNQRATNIEVLDAQHNVIVDVWFSEVTSARRTALNSQPLEYVFQHNDLNTLNTKAYFLEKYVEQNTNKEQKDAITQHVKNKLIPKMSSIKSPESLMEQIDKQIVLFNTEQAKQSQASRIIDKLKNLTAKTFFNKTTPNLKTLGKKADGRNI